MKYSEGLACRKIAGIIFLPLSFTVQAEDPVCRTGTGLVVSSVWRDYPGLLSVNNVKMMLLDTRSPAPGKEVAVYEIQYTPEKALVTTENFVWHVVIPDAYSREHYICSRSWRAAGR